jgi:colanic acid/amylovoran biosynthesis glycosyltransferase
MSSLLVVAPAPVIRRGSRLELDAKFAEGMALYATLWGGPVGCLLREGAAAIPFGTLRDPAALPFSVALLAPGEPVRPEHVAGHGLVMGSADSHHLLGAAAACRAAGVPCLLGIEYTLGTRLRVALLERRSLAQGLWSALWNLRTELRRRAAMRLADGLEANGYPAFRAYRGLNPRTLLYLDTRMGEALFATAAEMAAREARLMAGEPLRLLNSGRLEPMKGAQDLVPVAAALAAAGVGFTLDIYGTGSLEGAIREGIARHGLGERVRLHAPVDFASGLVPAARTGADLFLSCHRQSDPSCTYLESMGCGLPVAGYANGMLAALAAEAGAGWCAPLGRPAALAALIRRLDGARAEIAAHARAALAFSRAHGFREEFARRIAHARAVMAAGRRAPAPGAGPPGAGAIPARGRGA